MVVRGSVTWTDANGEDQEEIVSEAILELDFPNTLRQMREIAAMCRIEHGDKKNVVVSLVLVPSVKPMVVYQFPMPPASRRPPNQLFVLA